MTPLRQEKPRRSAESSTMAYALRADPPLIIEVLAPSIVGSGVPRVPDEQHARPPAPGQVGSEEAFRLMRVLDRLRDEFGSRVVVYLIEPLSFQWIVRVLRYRPRKYPAFIIGGREVIDGTDETIADRIARFLQRR
jgi:hypothetical protein